MIIRIPSTIDVVKVAALVYPDDVSKQSELVTVWLQGQADLVNFVAVHKKKIQGWIVGVITDGHVQVEMFKAETPEILASLWKKVIQTFEVDTAQVITNDPDCLTALQFEPAYVTMNYQAKGRDSQ